MPNVTSRLKSTALLKLENFAKAFTEKNRLRILSNEKIEIDIGALLKMEEYAEFIQAISDLNKSLSDTTPNKNREERLTA